MKIKFSLKPSKLLLLLTSLGVIFSTASFNINALADTPTAICQGIANDVNNNIPETKAQGNPVPVYRTLLKYDVDLGDKENTNNVVSTTGKGILLNGVSLNQIPNTLVDYANGTKYIRIKIPQAYQSALEGTITLEVLEGTVFENKILDGAIFTLRDEKWETVNKVSFSNIQWNDTGYGFYEDMKGILIGFDKNLSRLQKEIDGGIQSTNLLSKVGSHIYLGGSKISSLDGAFVSYHSQGFLFIYATNMSSYRTLEIDEATVVLNASLPHLYFNYNLSTKWTEKEKTYINATFTGIQWNDIGYLDFKDKKGVLLAYDQYLSQISAEYDGGIRLLNFASSIGEHILLGGKKLSTLPGAILSYYAQNFIFIYADNMPAYRNLKIEAGTKILDAILPELTLYYTTKDKWSTKEEDPTAVTFSNIYWNNAGHDAYEGKKGLLLSYSDNLSNAQSEIDGGIKFENFAKENIGEKIKIDNTPLKNVEGAEIMYFGTTFLWIYVPNMTSYSLLNIESIKFLTSVLPDTHFALFDDEWDESFKITNIINGVEKIDYRRKNGTTVLSEGYFESLEREEKVMQKLISFQVGSKVYRSNETLPVNEDTTVIATTIGFETSKGASIRISTPSNIRFETKISKFDYDYISSIYGSSNIETGTFIVPRNSMSLVSFDDYFNNPTNVEGVDYIKVVNKNFLYESNGNNLLYKYYGALEEVLPEDYCEEYCGIGYITIKDGENTYTLYGGNKLEIFSRSIKEVIQRAYKDYPEETVKHNDLNKSLDGILSLVSTSAGIQIDNIVDGYTPPYSIKFDSESKEYTVTGSAIIQTILINDEQLSDGAQIVNCNGEAYKLSNFKLSKNNNSSILKFNISSIAKASELVDFVLQFPTDRELRILQITDTQIIDSSQMRTPDRLGEAAIKLYSRSNVDRNCFNHITDLVEKTNPDLIVFTGDIVYGEFDDSGEIWTRMVEFMDSLNVPWAPVFGNHDNETKKGVAWQCEQLENAKNCLFKKGSLTGNGNYSIGLVDANGKIRRVIYMLDSNGCLKGSGIYDDQINWMQSVSSSIKNAYGEKVPGFACYHIASLDFKNALQDKYDCGETASINLDEVGLSGDFGQKNEKCSLFNVSMAPYLKASNIDGVFIGHDHVNNFSVDYDGIRYTYGTKTGTYDYYNGSLLGGTLVNVSSDGKFDVSHIYVNKAEVEAKEASSTTITVMSDLHVDNRDYGGFYCTKSKKKLRKIVSETPESKFYINLGDTVNSLGETFYTYYDAINVMKSLKLNVYNSQGADYIAGNRMIYNLIGNHEAAYNKKSDFKNYSPYIDEIGSAGVFRYKDLMFVAVDALFDRNGSDKPEDIITCTEFLIPLKEINYLRDEVASKMDSSIKGIVWISHVALQDIDEGSKGTLLEELRSYGLPMTIFEGHTHIEAYHELIDPSTGNVYCQEYTLPAVTLNNGYPYYQVIFKDGKIWCVDKRTKGEI